MSGPLNRRRPQPQRRPLLVALALAASLALILFPRVEGRNVKEGRMGTDLRYYYENNTNSDTTSEDGARTIVWESNTTYQDLAFSTPTVTRVEIPAADGTAKSYPGEDAYWLETDATYVVVSGNCTIGDGTDELGYGDVFFVLAGRVHGPIVNTGEGDLMLHIVGNAFEPIFDLDNVPSDDNPSVDDTLYTNRTYRRVDGNWRPNPDGVGYNMNFNAESGSPAVMRVLWDPSKAIPYHYHSTGAMYFILYGDMYFQLDQEGWDPGFGAGDIRWVRPGFAYGPEYNGDAEMEITVLGADSAIVFGDAPDGPYKVQKNVDLTQIYDDDDGGDYHEEL